MTGKEMKWSCPKAAGKVFSYAAVLYSTRYSLLVGLNPPPTSVGSYAHLPSSQVSPGTQKEGFIVFFL